MNGYNSIMDNVGKTRNTGVEIVLNSVNVETKDFRWGSTFNFALNRDKIIELRGDGNDDLTNKWFIGEPVRVHYDYDVKRPVCYKRPYNLLGCNSEKIPERRWR